ncbi:hypothetical protein, partial [Flavobacterium sp.]|uniref:hypothetical protein n=1 Tax=Flavobacterium sp. TaxID=239 RepID=UPI0037BEBCEA
ENLENLSELQQLHLDNNRISKIDILNLSNKINTISLNNNILSDVRILLQQFINTHNISFYQNSIDDNTILLNSNPLGDDLEARLILEDLDVRRKSLLDYLDNIKWAPLLSERQN